MLRGLEVEVSDFLPYPLLRLAEEMFARFQARNAEEELQSGLFRVAISTYSETAFREALANALIHRDYTRRGAVHVQWSEEQLEISSPGGFPSGIRLDNLLVAPPHPRSPLLADAFKRTGLVERTGRGINRMFAEQLRVRRPAPRLREKSRRTKGCRCASRNCRCSRNWSGSAGPPPGAGPGSAADRRGGPQHPRERGESHCPADPLAASLTRPPS